MRHSKTHFEQVPIEIVEIILRQETVLKKTPDESPGPAPEQQAEAKLSKEQTSAPSKGERCER